MRMNKIPIEKVLPLIQVLGLVVGGCWIMFRYLSHERQAQEIALEQSRLNYQQASAVALTQQQAEEAHLSQLRLGNQQASLALKVQDKAQDLGLEQQRLTNEQARLVLRTNEAQRSLRHEELEKSVQLQQQDIELKRLQQTKATHDIEYSQHYRFSRDFTLTAQKRGEINNLAEYAATYSFSFENKSEVQFEMSLFVLDIYVGVPKIQDPGATLVQPLGTPTDRCEKGAIQWKLVGTTGSILADAFGTIQSPWDGVIGELHLLRGGPGTAVLKPTQTLLYNEDYLVRAPKNAYLAIVMSYCFNRCKNNDDLYSRVNWLSLADAATVKP